MLYMLYIGGGEHSQILKVPSALGSVGTIFRSWALLGRFLGTLVRLAVHVVVLGRVFGILGASRLDFGGFRGGPERNLGAPRLYFSRFLRARDHAVRDMLDVHETPLKLMFGGHRAHCTQHKKRAKIEPTALQTQLSAKNAQQ